MSRATLPVSGKPYGMAAVCRVWRLARSGINRRQCPRRRTRHCDGTIIAETVGRHVGEIRRGVRRYFGGFAKGIAQGLNVRHAHGLQ